MRKLMISSVAVFALIFIPAVAFTRAMGPGDYKKIDLKKRIAMLKEYENLARQKGKEKIAKKFKRARKLAEDALKEKSPPLMVLPKIPIDKNGKKRDGAGCTSRSPADARGPGWENKKAGENHEMSFLFEEAFQGLFNKFETDGNTTADAQLAVDIAATLTLAHEMRHVDQGSGELAKNYPNATKPTEADAYNLEAELGDFILQNDPVLAQNAKLRSKVQNWVNVAKAEQKKAAKPKPN
jgi:hypothetical protein